MVDKVQFLTGIFLILFVVFFGIYLAKVMDAGKHKMKLILYLVVTALLLGLSGLLGLAEFTRLPVIALVAAELWALVLGIFHAWLFEKMIPLENKNFGRIFFTLATCFLAYLVITLMYKAYFHKPFPLYFLSPGLFYVAPVFVIIAFEYFIGIPAMVYKIWEFPAPGTLADPSDSEMADPIIVNFRIRKKPEETPTVFKAKAPKGMKLGRLFYFFIMDYNSRHTDNPILVNDGEKTLCQWSFCMTSGIFAGKAHLDAEQSISKNGIKENASVICERIIS